MRADPQTHRKVPGVGKYEIRPKNEKVNADKVVGNYTNREAPGGFVDSAVAHGMSTPSHYEAIELNKIKNRVTNAHIVKPKEPKPDNRIQKDNSPSPQTYKKDAAWEKAYGHNSRFTFTKTVHKPFVD